MKSSKKIIVARLISLLIQWNDYSSMCYRHTRVMTTRAEFIINLNNVKFNNWLKHLHQNCQNIDNVKIAKEIYRWFQIKEKSAWLIDVLDNFCFFHHTMLEHHVSLNVLKMLFANFTAFELFKWCILDNIVRESFKWWFDLKIIIFDYLKTSIEEVVLIEYEMYFHHQREIQEHTSWSWFKSMIYLLTQ